MLLGYKMNRTKSVTSGTAKKMQKYGLIFVIFLRWSLLHNRVQCLVIQPIRLNGKASYHKSIEVRSGVQSWLGNVTFATLLTCVTCFMNFVALMTRRIMNVCRWACFLICHSWALTFNTPRPHHPGEQGEDNRLVCIEMKTLFGG